MACKGGLRHPRSNSSAGVALQPPLSLSWLPPTHDCPLRCIPAPQIFRGDLNKPAPYEGPRDEPGIVKYLKKQVGCGGSGVVGAEGGREESWWIAWTQFAGSCKQLCGVWIRWLQARSPQPACPPACPPRLTWLPPAPAPCALPPQVMPAFAKLDSAKAIKAARDDAGAHHCPVLHAGSHKDDVVAG